MKQIIIDLYDLPCDRLLTTYNLAGNIGCYFTATNIYKKRSLILVSHAT